MSLSELESDLSHGLSQLADDTLPAAEALFFEGVARRRSASVRRRAVASTSAVVLSVAAVVAGASALTPTRTETVRPSTAKPVSRTSPSPAVNVGRVVSGAVAAARLPVGAPPSIPYVRGHVLHDGARSAQLPVDALHVDRIVRLGDGWIVSTRAREEADAGPVVLRVADDGAVQTIDGEGLRLFGNQNDTRAVWLDRSRRLVSIDQNGVRRSTNDRQAAVGFVSPDELAVREGPEVSFWDIASNAMSSHSPTDIGRTERFAFNDFDNSRRTSGPASIPCTVTRSLADSRVLWRSCEWIVISHSPDGRRAMAIPVNEGALAHATRLAILDVKTGAVQAEFHGELMSTAVWEDNSSILFLSSQDGSSVDHATYSLVRCGVDGHCARADDPAGNPLTWNERLG